MNTNNKSERFVNKINFRCPQCSEVIPKLTFVMNLTDHNIFYGECSLKHGFNLHVYFTGEFEILYWTNVLPEYREYINSDEWKNKSKHAKEKAEWKCQLCNKPGTNKTLHTHHRTYENLGNENDMDLIVLCQSCHAKFHEKEYI